MHSLVSAVKVNAVRRLTLASLMAVALLGAYTAETRSAQRPAHDRLSEDAAVLARAVAALEEAGGPGAKGVPGELLRSLAGLADGESGLSDYATLLLARAVAPSDPDRAGSLLSALLTSGRSSPALLPAAAELASLLAASGRAKEVAALVEAHAGLNSPDAARICLAAGRVLADKQPGPALEHLLSAREKAPGSAVARAAAETMDGLRARPGARLPEDAQALLRESRIEGRSGRWHKQRPLLERFLVLHGSHARAVEATVDLSLTIARTKGRAAAAEWIDNKARAETGTRKRARYLFESAAHRWNGDQSSVALDGFRAMLALGSGIEQEQNAHYASGRIHEAARRYTAAAVSYRTATKGVDQVLAAESAWRAGWVSYLAGNFSGAAWVFSKLAGTGGAAATGAPAMYWQARSLERDGRTDDARRVLAELIDRYPDGYYAYMAEKRSGLGAVAASVDRKLPDRPTSDTERFRLDRARALGAAGLDRWARAEIETLLAEVDPGRQAALLPEAVRLGAYTTALRKAFDLHRKGIISWARVNAFVYPKAYGDIVAEKAARHGLEPALVWALMRQESAFDPVAVSPSAAYGLMQLLLPTARRIAPLAGLDGEIDSERLFQPAVNIALGTAYLAKLAAQFDADTVLMLAGYNAGERASERWQTRLGHLEEDEFIESISYRQTRDYVKKVLRNLRNYRRLAAAASAAGQGVEQSAR